MTSFRVLRFPTLDSTSTELKRRALAGEDIDGLAVLSDGQTAGRGRLGRSFVSPSGKGIYLSCALRPHCPPEELATVTAWAAVAAADAVARVCGVRPGVKWPNDLVLGGKKLCGILTESLPTAAGQTVILGVGLNVSQTAADFGPEVAETAVSLETALGAAMDRTALQDALLDTLSTLRQSFPAEKAAYLTRYRADCLTVGKPVRVLWPAGAEDCYAEAVADDFSLLVRRGDGSAAAVSSGEVSVRGLYGYV